MKGQTARSSAGIGSYGPPDRKPLTGLDRGGFSGVCYYEAVHRFRRLGYVVEPGPRCDEVTLINDQRPRFVTHIVVPAEKLAAMVSPSQTIAAQQLFRHRTLAIRGGPSQHRSRQSTPA